MAAGTITRILTIAGLGVCLSGCSTLTALFQGKDTRPAVTDPTRTSAAPSSGSSATSTETLTIPRLTERDGVDADDARQAKDLWDRIRIGLQLSGGDRAEIQKEIDFYTRKNGFIERTTQRSRPYLHYIVEELERRQMPLDLALLPIVESAFRPTARSRSGAVGMWQFIAATGRRYGLERNKWYDGRRDVIASTHAALDYLQELHGRFGGDWLNAIAAYNCGERNVERAIEANRAAGRPTDFWSLDLPSETRVYVPRLLALTTLFSSPLRYNIKLQPIANEPYLAVVDIPGQIDLNKAANAAGVTAEEMRALNPGLLKTVTAPGGPRKLVVPLARVDMFKQALAGNIADLAPGRAIAMQGHAANDVSQREHRVRKGDSLSSIASRYDVTVEALRELNEVNPRRLKLGQTILVPVTDSVASEPEAPSTASSEVTIASLKPVVTDGATQIIHTVRAGDNLWTIARRYDTRVRDLVAWNAELSPESVLRIDQKIVVWTAATTGGGDAIAGATMLKTSMPAELPSDGSFKLVRYEIRYGDSLWTIAQQFKVSVDQLRLWNGMPEHKVLQPGDNIDVYVVAADPARNDLRI